MSRPSRVAIITGGGSGIGAAIAARLTATGTAVALVGRRTDRLVATAELIRASGGLAIEVTGDLRDAAEPSRIVDRVLEEWDRVDVLVNNAAYIRNLSLADIDAEEFDRHYETNLRGPILMTQAALPALRRSGTAAVVNISSSSASLAIPTQLMYASLKSALESATRILAAELAPDGIRVNAIAPGPIETEIHLLWAGNLEHARVALEEAVPLGRVGQPDEIAKWVDYATRPDEGFITGAVIPVDGGQTLNSWNSSIGHSPSSTAGS